MKAKELIKILEKFEGDTEIYNADCEDLICVNDGYVMYGGVQKHSLYLEFEEMEE